MKKSIAVVLAILMLFTLFQGTLRENIVSASETYRAEALIEKEASQKVIILQVGKTSFTVDGVTNTLDSPPIIKNSRTLFPIRAIIEALGGSVDWNDTEKMVTVTLKDTTLILWINKPQAQLAAPLLILRWIDDTNHKVVP